MKTIIRYTHVRDWLFIALALLLTAVQVKLELLFPEYFKAITSLIQAEKIDTGGLISMCLQMLAFVAGAFCCAVVTVLLISVAASAITTRMRQALFDKIMSFSLTEVARFTTPSLISRCTYDIMQVQLLTSAPQMLTRALLSGILAIMAISGMNIVWTSITAGSVILMVALFSFLIFFLMKPTMRLNRLADRLNRISLEHLTGLRVIRAYNAQDYQQKKFDSVNQSVADTNIFINNRMAVIYPAVTLFNQAVSLLIYFTGVKILEAAGAAHRQLLFSDMIATVFYAQQVIMAFFMLISLMIMMPRIIASLKRITEVLDAEVSIRDGRGVSVDSDQVGKVEFRNVSFRYPGSTQDALSGISFTVDRGQTVAIIGSTGSGKTSILNLIPRLYDTSEGTVLVDGFDVKDFALSDLRERLGYVPQKSMLFSMSIARNIGYGESSRFQATLDHIREAAEIGQASEFIEKQEAGYMTEVQQGGKNFSGGQKQRLTISRAISRNPEIYIFDDSFSALDFKTDKNLRRKLRETAGDATMIIVAQRISTIMGADHIIVIDKGHIVGTGTHSELMASCEIYREMAASQSINQ